MKNRFREEIMSIILGLVSLIIAVAISIAATVFLNFEVLHFSIMFIIPIGALIIGGICGYGYFKGLVLSNKAIKGSHYLIALVMGIICLGVIKYGTYQLTCINPETYDIEYTLNGDHISNYELPEYGQMTFMNFNRYLIETTPISFSLRRKQVAEVSNKTLSWVLAIIDYLGVIMGCLVASSFATGDRTYCEKCKRYMKRKHIFNIPKEDGEGFFIALETLLAESMPTETLKNLEQRFNKNAKEYYKCYLSYCESCKKTTLDITLLEKVAHNKYRENKEFEYKKNIDYNLIKAYTDKNVG